MKQPLFYVFALSALLIGMPIYSADAAGFGGKLGVSHGHKQGRGHSVRHGKGFNRGHGFGSGVAVSTFVDDGSDFAELYRELLDNVPYFALHPPVYYSYPVPRTYGYSPFAYGPWVMTPELAAPPEPLTIINPYVPKAQQKAASETNDRAAQAQAQPEPLVIINPYAAPNRAVARSEQ
jgi:hypothetical protein